jgi:hypothetical protein
MKKVQIAEAGHPRKEIKLIPRVPIFASKNPKKIPPIRLPTTNSAKGQYQDTCRAEINSSRWDSRLAG